MANKDDTSFEDNGEESFLKKDDTPPNDSSCTRTGGRWPTNLLPRKGSVKETTGKVQSEKKSVMAETLAMSMIGRSPELSAHSLPSTILDERRKEGRKKDPLKKKSTLTMSLMSHLDERTKIEEEVARSNTVEVDMRFPRPWEQVSIKEKEHNDLYIFNLGEGRQRVHSRVLQKPIFLETT